MEKILLENQQRIAPFKDVYPNAYSHLEFMESMEGWRTLIAGLSAVIEAHIKYKLPEEVRDQVYIVQMKQKMGSLRVYMSHSIPEIEGAILMAQIMSQSLCETCGNAAQKRNIKGWLTALCDTHYQQKMDSQL